MKNDIRTVLSTCEEAQFIFIVYLLLLPITRKRSGWRAATVFGSSLYSTYEELR